MDRQTSLLDWIDKKELGKQINVKLSRKLEKPLYEITLKPAIDFLTGSRLDLVPKIVYAKWMMGGIDSDYAKKLYLSSIATINGFVEADGSGKIGEEAFVNAFNKLIEDVSIHGLSKSYPVPISGTGILDGAHRTAIAIALNLDLPTIELGCRPHEIGYKELSFGGLNSNQLDYIVLQYCLLKPNTRLVFIWPSAIGCMQQLENVLENYCQIVYRKEINFSKNGQKNIVRLAYSKEGWLGSYEDGFMGAQNKASWCFDHPGPAVIYVVESTSDLIAMKDEVRSLFGIGKHSIHINDTHQETVELSKYLLNANGVTFVNKHTPEKFTWFSTLFQHYKQWLKENALDCEDLCIEGSAVMAAFGIREARDLDFVARKGIDVTTGYKEIDCNKAAHLEYRCTLDELIYDPDNYFYFEGYKALSLTKLIEKKKARAEEKDLVDVSLIEAKLSGLPVRHVAISLRDLFKVSRLKYILKFFALKIRFRLYKTFRRIKSVTH